MTPRPLTKVRCATCKKLMFLRPTRGAAKLASQGKPYRVQSVAEYVGNELRTITITSDVTPIRCQRCEEKAGQLDLVR